MFGSFYEVDGERFVPTPLCRGPWDDRFQHGGPPAALLGAALAAIPAGEPGETRPIARLTVELLRPVPLAPLHLTTRIDRAGRTVDRVAATLLTDSGEAVAEAMALRIAPLAVDVPFPPAADGVTEAWPDPDTLPPYLFTFFRSEWGYHRAIGLRLATGSWGTTPVGFWARPLVPLVLGRPLTPLEQTLILADAQSGMGPPLDPSQYTFLNPDLTVYFERMPRLGWVGFDIRSVAGKDGIGLAQSALRDAVGPFGRSLQALVVRRR